MSCEDIVRALRCLVAPEWAQANCNKCQYWRVQRFSFGKIQACDETAICVEAAERIEQLAAENQSLDERLDENIGAAKMWERRYKDAADMIEQLKKEIEWKDMVIALAQRKQAEAERNALDAAAGD